MALWPFFFCPAVAWRSPDSSRPDPGMFIAPALKVGQIADGGMPPI